MKLKVDHVLNATLVVAQIIREARPLPLKGSYRLSRLHARLLPEFNAASAKRDEMIVAYGYKARLKDAKGEEYGEEVPQVPPDRMPEFNARWAEIGNEEIEVDVEPIPFAQLDLGDGVAGSITANELITLGSLVADPQ